MTIYSADREELNEQMRSYQETISQYNTRTSNAIKATNHASTLLSAIIPTNRFLKTINTSDTNRMTEEIKTFWDDLVQADINTKNRIYDVQKGTHSINERVRSFMDLLGNNGSKLPNLKPIQLYETMWSDKNLIKNIVEKMDSGIVLTFAEQELLYHYFQNEFLSETNNQEINNIAGYINENDIDQLKDRLNEKVIVSEEALLKEIELIQVYLYLGNKRPGEGPGDMDIRDKLNSYLLLLENYTKKMNDDVFIIVDDLKFKDTEEGKRVYFFQSALETVSYENRGGLSKVEFNKHFLETRPTDRKDLNIIDSVYYPGSNARSTFDYIKKNDLEKKLANLSKDLLIKDVSTKIISTLAKRNAIGMMLKTTNQLNKISNSNAAYQELQDEIEIESLLITSNRLEMNFNISNAYYTENSDEELHVKLYPTDATYEILDRWKLASMINNEIPYPTELIESQDWYEIDKQLDEILESYIDKLPRLKTYIMDSVLTNTTVEEISTED